MEIHIPNRSHAIPAGRVSRYVLSQLFFRKARIKTYRQKYDDRDCRIEIPTVHFSKNIEANENKRIFVVIKVMTDKGQAGYSIAGHFVHQAYHAMVEGICQAAEFMLAKSPSDRLSIWEYLRIMERRGILPSRAFGAIDVALWDLCGKIAEAPISHLLGRALAFNWI
jgi:L-alanine-DL-glutamate epimerase-like enolase superfamily enzyme